MRAAVPVEAKNEATSQTKAAIEVGRGLVVGGHKTGVKGKKTLNCTIISAIFK